MQYTKRDLLIFELRILGTIASIALFGVLAYRYAELSYTTLNGLFTAREFNMTDFAFVIVFSTIFGCALYVRACWKEKSTFIYIADNHLVVAPVDRRDEFLEISPSYA